MRATQNCLENNGTMPTRRDPPRFSLELPQALPCCQSKMPRPPTSPSPSSASQRLAQPSNKGNQIRQQETQKTEKLIFSRGINLYLIILLPSMFSAWTHCRTNRAKQQTSRFITENTLSFGAGKTIYIVQNTLPFSAKK